MPVVRFSISIHMVSATPRVSHAVLAGMLRGGRFTLGNRIVLRFGVLFVALGHALRRAVNVPMARLADVRDAMRTGDPAWRLPRYASLAR
ncbi:hypothetical protein ACQUJT_12480 [Ralstonia pseudosolanacearum]|uniref:Uncharacterized protein n=2 Tax=Ralstonia solanacearum species complex TaxID=3116862 RepID=A0AA92QDE6_RALSL|nr:hypothetical protein [Ralstonia pseudosolanacearum]QOK94253.1 hypothetical protein HF908_22860 [Ralstonia pseudosolanacearum]QOK99046.1 hypothetical protein HF909_21990 [Ralstonia pseudosolanacearum]UWD87915.1 hypothetical protein NY025_03980 [Ralstonia pseudosolanacearum]CAH0443419.1 hypothetical protein LMG9673_04036 [Ralstonia pseudosolanacearum]